MNTIDAVLKYSEDLETRDEEAAIDAVGRIGMCELSLDVLNLPYFTFPTHV
jgi:hypothetical protein